MRLVDTTVTDLRLAEVGNEKVLVRRIFGEEYQVNGLYKVLIVVAKKKKVILTKEVYILADHEAGAECQASCFVDTIYSEKTNEYTCVYKTERVPFGIRGWSSHTF
jgi:hypothetical protein